MTNQIDLESEHRRLTEELATTTRMAFELWRSHRSIESTNAKIAQLEMELELVDRALRYERAAKGYTPFPPLSETTAIASSGPLDDQPVTPHTTPQRERLSTGNGRRRSSATKTS